MKKKFYLFLFIIPVVLFILVINLKIACGPYGIYLYDQSYAFLGTALRYTHISFERIFLKPSASFQINGIPADIVGAFLMKINFLLSGMSKDFLTDVFTRPENYLQLIHRSFLILNCIAVLFIGIFTFKISDNHLLSVLLQLSPFISFTVYYSFTIVCLEQILILLSLLLICTFIYYLYNSDYPENIPLKFIFALGIICGTGISTKLNFLPLIFTPIFIIKGKKNKLIFIATAIITFFVFTIPLIFQNSKLFTFISNLIMHNERYGQGEPTIINVNSFVENIYLIFSEDLIFTLAFCVAFLTIIISKFKRSNSKDQTFTKSWYLLKGLFIAFNFQVLIVAKHYAQYYMVPSLIFSNLSLFVSVLVLFSVFNIPNRKLNSVIIFLIFCNLTYSIYQYDKLHEILDWNRQESERINNYVTNNHKKELLITSFGNSNSETAVANCAIYTYDPEHCKNLMNKILKNKIFYSPFTYNFYTICNEEEFMNLLKSNNKLLFQVKGDYVLPKFMNELTSIKNIRINGTKELFKNEIEQFVYEISYDFK